jgi:hypothetical protein
MYIATNLYAARNDLSRQATRNSRMALEPSPDWQGATFDHVSQGRAPHSRVSLDRGRIVVGLLLHQFPITNNLRASRGFPGRLSENQDVLVDVLE